MFEKEAKERAKDFTDNKERQAAYECGFLDGADRMRAEMQKLEEEKCELLGIIQDKDKAIKELEEKFSVLLSCKNCPENKGGYICQKEYEDKCLAQKIQYIKELQEENEELKEELEKLKNKNKALEMYADLADEKIDELKEKLAGAERTRDNLIQIGFPTFQSCKEYADKMNYAKAIIKDLLNNSDEYARQRAIDFLKEE